MFRFWIRLEFSSLPIRGCEFCFLLGLLDIVAVCSCFIVCCLKMTFRARAFRNPSLFSFLTMIFFKLLFLMNNFSLFMNFSFVVSLRLRLSLSFGSPSGWRVFFMKAESSKKS